LPSFFSSVTRFSTFFRFARSDRPRAIRRLGVTLFAVEARSVFPNPAGFSPPPRFFPSFSRHQRHITSSSVGLLCRRALFPSPRCLHFLLFFPLQCVFFLGLFFFFFSVECVLPPFPSRSRFLFFLFFRFLTRADPPPPFLSFICSTIVC